MKKILVACALMAIATSSSVNAGGFGGELYITGVSAEGGAVYITAAGFGNPDNCSNSSIAVIKPVDASELDRMYSIAVTALANKNKISIWFNGCGPSPWYQSIPNITSIRIAA